MSELKAYIGPHPTDLTLTEYYLKDEADKVIAEKNNELRHQKYKRCLAMAYVEWLKQMILRSYSESILYRRAVTLELKWKELAEKFKPNNLTAQL